MKKVLIAFFAVFCVLFGAFTAAGQSLSYDVTGVVDMPMGDLADFAGTGFGVGADVFFWSPPSMPDLQVGGRAAFNYFTEDLGTVTTIELVPTVRYNMPAQGNIRFFGQAGMGFFVVGSKYEYETYDFSSYPFSTVTKEESDSETKFGLTFGGGAIITLSGGRELVVMPLFNIVEDANYLGLNVGLVLQ